MLFAGNMCRRYILFLKLIIINSMQSCITLVMYMDLIVVILYIFVSR